MGSVSSQQVCYRKCISRAGEARLSVINSSLVATLLVGALLLQFGVQLHVSRSHLHFSFPSSISCLAYCDRVLAGIKIEHGGSVAHKLAINLDFRAVWRGRHGQMGNA